MRGTRPAARRSPPAARRPLLAARCSPGSARALADLLDHADTLQHIVQKAAHTKRADFLGLFWDVYAPPPNARPAGNGHLTDLLRGSCVVRFGYMRDLAVLRCDGLSAKELTLLRMVAAAPCAMDMTEKCQTNTGKKILGSLLDLAESFLREFYQTTVVPHVTSIEDYETAASACAQQASHAYRSRRSRS